MQFTAEILIYTLSGTTAFYTNIAFHEFLPLDYIEVWENGLPAKDTLYLVRAEQILQDPSIWRGRVVFCSGRVDPGTAEKYGIHLISVSDRITVKELSHIAQSARNTYTEYCWSLQKMAAERHSFNDLLTYTERVYQISGCLTTRSMRIIGLSEHFRDHNAWIEGEDSVALSTANALSTDPDFLKAADLDNVFPYSDINSDWYYCYNFRRDQLYNARLICCLESHSQYYGVTEIVQILGETIDHIYEDYSEQSPYTQAGDSLCRLLQDLLHGTRVPSSERSRIMRLSQWEDFHEFQLIIFHFLPGAGDSIGSEYHRAQIQRLFSESQVLIWDDQYVCVRDLTLSGEDAESHRDRLPYFVRETLCKAGFSDPFTGLSSLPDHFAEAQQALLLGELMRPTEWIYVFMDYKFRYLLEHCTGDLQTAQLIHPAIRTLIAYDRKNNTVLKESLDVFLQNNHNIAVSSQRLSVHRTTLLARLERIRELTGIDLKDHRLCLHLMLSFELLRRESDAM